MTYLSYYYRGVSSQNIKSYTLCRSIYVQQKLLAVKL